VLLANHFEIGRAAAPEDVAAVRTRHGIPLERKLVIYTGSFVALQALDLLLDAIPEVLACVPNTTFLLVGGSDAEIAALRSQATRLGILAHVILERSVPQASIPAYLAAADVLVSPRVQGINSPGKLLDYLASGRPVVATDTTVHNQLLTDKSAILTPPNPLGLAAGLVTALTDPARVAEITAGAAKLLGRYSSKAERDAAYEAVLHAARAATLSRVRRGKSAAGGGI
jgi:glycosyltransferase involved in cell wall biosynthesis